MRMLCVLVALCSVWPAATSLAQSSGDQFPYTGYVTADDVYVRSGPGKSYYPTDKLARGDEVEVWRHDPGGWYAVRPLPSSFSWVRGRHLKPTRDEGIYTVEENAVVARVGSSLRDVRDVIQIRLDKGEEVQVLETVDVSGEPWCRIAPPAGEFRWVFGRFITTESTDDVAPGGSRRNLLIDEPKRPARTTGDAIDTHDSTAEVAGNLTATDTRSKRPQRHVDWQAPAGSAPGGMDVDEAVQQAGHEAPAERVSATAPRREDRAARSGDSPPRDAASLDVALSRIVAQEASQWQFDDLKSQATAQLERARTAVERGRARLVLAKIERFESIRDRYEVLRAQGADLDGPSGTSTAARSQTAADRYDAVGQLLTNDRRQAEAPPFVLVDAAGDVVSYVTPAPGVNLRSYVGRKVGITGLRGFISKLNSQHVAAKHVDVLDETLRR